MQFNKCEFSSERILMMILEKYIKKKKRETGMVGEIGRVW